MGWVGDRSPTDSISVSVTSCRPSGARAGSADGTAKGNGKAGDDPQRSHVRSSHRGRARPFTAGHDRRGSRRQRRSRSQGREVGASGDRAHGPPSSLQDRPSEQPAEGRSGPNQGALFYRVETGETSMTGRRLRFLRPAACRLCSFRRNGVRARCRLRPVHESHLQRCACSWKSRSARSHPHAERRLPRLPRPLEVRIRRGSPGFGLSKPLVLEARALQGTPG